MKKFDSNESGLVMIGDVYGNALLVSSPRKKSQPNRLLPLAHNRSPSPPTSLVANQYLIRKGVHSSRVLGGGVGVGQRKPTHLLPLVTASDTSSIASTSTKGGSRQSKRHSVEAGGGGGAGAGGGGEAEEEKEKEKELYRKCVYELALLPGTSVSSSFLVSTCD
jgi:hypothetical protein